MTTDLNQHHRFLTISEVQDYLDWQNDQVRRQIARVRRRIWWSRLRARVRATVARIRSVFA
jgi:predicted transcriptional regulator of viral defense system